MLPGLTTVVRELWWDDLAAVSVSAGAAPTAVAAAATVAGEPRRALAALDGVGADGDQGLVERLRHLAIFLDQNWWPGPAGAVMTSSTSIPPPPENPATGDQQRDVFLAWVAHVIPMSLSCRSIATSARRAGVERGRQMAANLAQTVEGWANDAQNAGDVVAALHATLVLADVLRRCGASDLAAEALARAEATASPIGPAATAACLLLRGDSLVSPLQSPETLGFDLEATQNPPEAPDAPARTDASAYYDMARELYQSAGARRGVAAVDLRLAHLARLEGRYEQARELLRGAGETFEAAGDGAGRILALAQAAAVGLEAGSALRTEPGLVVEIVDWAATVGSQTFAIGCARLIECAASWARERGLVDAALAGFGLATRLTRRLGIAEFALAAVEDVSELYARLNSRGVTIALCEEALVELLEPYDGLAADGPLDLMVWLRAAEFAMSIQREIVEERDPEGLTRSAATMRRLLARSPGGPRTPLPPDTDLLNAQQQAVRRRAELEARLGGPDAGGATWEEVDEASVELTVVMLTLSVYTAEIYAEVARGIAAALAGETTEGAEAFHAALVKADALGAAGTSLALTALANRGAQEELVRRTRAFLLLDASADIHPDFAVGLWVNAGCFDEAARVLDAAGTQDPQPGPPYAGWEEFELRARIALGLGRTEAGSGYAAQAVQRFESWFSMVPGDAFRVALGDDAGVRRCYHTAARAAETIGDHQAAFAALDRLRSLGLAGLLAERRWEEGVGDSAPVLRAWREAQAFWSAAYDRRRSAWQSADPAVLASTEAEVEAATHALDRAAAELDQAIPDVARRRPAPLAPATAQDVMTTLPADAVVVEYLLAEDELLIWTLTGTTCQGRRLPVDSLSVSGTAARAHRAMASASGGSLDEDLAQLSATLLDPVRSELDGHARLVVVPFGSLHLLPFHVLPFGGGLLGDARAVSQLPAASLIPHGAERSAPRLDRGALVVGDPATNPGRGHPRLPGAAVEAGAVARALGVEPLVGEAATEAATRAALPESSIAHFACHGLLDEVAPNLSSLVFAGDDEITVAELLGLELDLDLAVLSACDTGRGDVTSVGEVIGLARGLLAAGCRHTVVSLWPVDDICACLTMAAFADRIAAGSDVARALADARAHTRGLGGERTTRYLELAGGERPPEGTRTRDGRPPSGGFPPPEHPYWWAPFVHIGV